MPSIGEKISYVTCTSSNYNSLSEKDDNTLYFLSDTHQMFIGSVEYTTSAQILKTRPTSSTKGEEGRIYVCESDGSSFAYIGNTWVTVYDSTKQVVTKLNTGDGLTGGPITGTGTVSHAVPSGATDQTPSTEAVKLDYGDTFTVHETKTDKFGHVTGILNRNITVPSIDQLSTVFKFKGTVQRQSDLPTTSPSVGDVYYVVEDSAEYVFMESESWEKLGPVLDITGLIPKMPNNTDCVAMFTSEGYLQSAGYKNVSGATAGTYGVNEDSMWDEEDITVPQLTVDKYGRVTSIKEKDIQHGVVDEAFAVDTVAWIVQQYLH